MADHLSAEFLITALAASDEQIAAALRVLQGKDTGEHVTTEPYLTLKEVGRKLNLHPSTLWRWDVPGHSLGGRKRFRLSDILAYLESSKFRTRVNKLRADRLTKHTDNP